MKTLHSITRERAGKERLFTAIQDSWRLDAVRAARMVPMNIGDIVRVYRLCPDGEQREISKEHRTQ